MQAFTSHHGIVVPFDRANVDTDLIIPKQFLKAIKKTGFGPNLFDQLRIRMRASQGWITVKGLLIQILSLTKKNLKMVQFYSQGKILVVGRVENMHPGLYWIMVLRLF